MLTGAKGTKKKVKYAIYPRPPFCEHQPMSTGVTEIAHSTDVVEEYRTTVRELCGNLERLKELLELQILLEGPPAIRRGSHSDSSGPLIALTST